MSKTKQSNFLKAYESCHESLVRYCSALAHGKMDAEDLVQDVLLAAYANFDKIKNKDQLLHYLLRAARNRSVSKFRKQKYKATLLEKHTERLAAQEVSADTILEIQLLYKTLDQLPEKQKDALILFEINGFSIKEIAVIQKKSEGAVKTNISRGRQKLKEIMTAKNEWFTQVFGTIKTITL